MPELPLQKSNPATQSRRVGPPRPTCQPKTSAPLEAAPPTPPRYDQLPPAPASATVPAPIRLAAKLSQAPAHPPRSPDPSPPAQPPASLRPKKSAWATPAPVGSPANCRFEISKDGLSVSTRPNTYNAENQLTPAGGVPYTYDGKRLRTMKSSAALSWPATNGRVLAHSAAACSAQRSKC